MRGLGSQNAASAHHGLRLSTSGSSVPPRPLCRSRSTPTQLRRSSSSTPLLTPATSCHRPRNALDPRPPAATSPPSPAPLTGPDPQQGSLYQPMTDILPFQGHIRLEVIPGAGLGWVAAQQLRAGDLILISQPLAILHSSEEGSQPSGAELVDYLEQMQEQRMLSEAQQAWLHLLQASTGRGSGSQGSGGVGGAEGAAGLDSGRQGTASDAPGAAGPSGRGVEAEWRLQRIQHLMRSETPPAPGSSSSSAAASWSCEPEVSSLPPLTREALALKTSANCYGNPCQDAGVMAARQMPYDQYPGGHIGIFPWFSFFNHSCSPNASYMVIDNSLVVRAAAPVAEGEQVCVSYIGPRVLEPVGQRQLYLQEAYGFRCTCPRCSFESRVPGSLAAHVRQTFMACQGLQPAAAAAMEANDALTVYEMDRSLFEAWQALHDAVSELELEPEPGCSPGPDARVLQAQGAELAARKDPASAGPGVSLQQLSWLEASLWCVLQLQQGLFDHDVVPESVALAAEVVGAVAPGSELHLTLAGRQVVALFRLLMMSRAAARARQIVRRSGRRAARADGVFARPEQLERQFGEAAQGCVAAYTARYGPVPAQTLRLLMSVNLTRAYSEDEVQACLGKLFEDLTGAGLEP